MYKPISGHSAGKITGKIIAKRIKGEEVTLNQDKLLNAFCKIFKCNFYGIPIDKISPTGIYTERFGKVRT